MQLFLKEVFTLQLITKQAIQYMLGSFLHLHKIPLIWSPFCAYSSQSSEVFLWRIRTIFMKHCKGQAVFR